MWEKEKFGDGSGFWFEELIGRTVLVFVETEGGFVFNRCGSFFGGRDFSIIRWTIVIILLWRVIFKGKGF